MHFKRGMGYSGRTPCRVPQVPFMVAQFVTTVLTAQQAEGIERILS